MMLSARLIREARAAAGLTQAELAERAGTSQPTIAAYEAGDKVPNVSTLERVLGATGTTLTTSRSPGTRRSGRLRRLLDQRRDEIVEVAAQHHARNVRVFGSVARGDSTSVSDLDLLVEMEAGRSYLDLVGFWQDVEEALACRVDVVADGGVSPYLRDKIYGEAVPL